MGRLGDALEQCPALGFAMQREYAEEQENMIGGDTKALMRFFNEERRKKAGVFARYKGKLELFSNK